MTTSRKSNCLKFVLKELKLCQQEYVAIKIDETQITQHLNSLFDGFGIRILNTIDVDSLGVFLFYFGDYYLLRDSYGLAHRSKISDEDAQKILALFYTNRALSNSPKLYGDAVIDTNIELNKRVNDLLKE